MGHQTQQKQSVTLAVFSGLVTNSSPDSIPEGASSLCFDVDFNIGSVYTRAGLINPYSFAPAS
jgi:hypothetical protein